MYIYSFPILIYYPKTNADKDLQQRIYLQWIFQRISKKNKGIISFCFQVNLPFQQKYTCICKSLFLSLSLSLYIYIYTILLILTRCNEKWYSHLRFGSRGVANTAALNPKAPPKAATVAVKAAVPAPSQAKAKGKAKAKPWWVWIWVWIWVEHLVPFLSGIPGFRLFL